MRFCRIPSIRHQLAKRQLPFIGKVVRNYDNQFPTRLLTAWRNHPRRRGAPLQNNKKNLVKIFNLLSPPQPTTAGCHLGRSTPSTVPTGTILFPSFLRSLPHGKEISPAQRKVTI